MRLAWWRLAYCALSLANLVVVPVFLLVAWLANLVHRGQDHAEIRALHAQAMERTQAERQGRRT